MRGDNLDFVTLHKTELTSAMLLFHSSDILANFIDWPPRLLTALYSSLYMENDLRCKTGLFIKCLKKSCSLGLSSRNGQCQDLLDSVEKSSWGILAAVNA